MTSLPGLFSSLNQLPPPVTRELASLKTMKVPKGTVLFCDGDACQGYVFVLDDGTHTLRLTHQQLATELGTAREVISRILKAFERRGHVLLGRGSVTLKDPDALWHIATVDA